MNTFLVLHNDKLRPTLAAMRRTRAITDVTVLRPVDTLELYWRVALLVEVLAGQASFYGVSVIVRTMTSRVSALIHSRHPPDIG
ncbi:DNA-binding transcriptional regulator [Pseudomonas syringae pv. actinidiae]|uniref:DNA-binding transcriptional regulator n=1 Tax=Pseudomonas syringae pv. actinidiae TaxID=103796 RepID=A0A2V0QDH6_PSESF|nr:DNA-binding transcriptional regulator [Pseudomonas syringae pv. actinidiae]